MSNYIFPNQNRFSDPYQQRITDYGSTLKQKYLSRISNTNLKSISDNIVLKGFAFRNLSFVTSYIYAQINTGAVICDDTLIETLTSVTLDFDVALLDDTPTDGCHLALVTDFKYIESPDADSQTPMKMRLYHVSADGNTITPGGFDLDRSKVLLGVINFTKSGSNVISVSENTGHLTILGTTYYNKGYDPSNINFYSTFNQMVSDAFADFMSGSGLDEWKKQLRFMDMSRL